MRWCRGNIGDKIFAPWLEQLTARGVELRFGERVVDFDAQGEVITAVDVQTAAGEKERLEADSVVTEARFAVVPREHRRQDLRAVARAAHRPRRGAALR